MKTVIAQVVQSYSGRKELMFNEREFEDFMSECLDGDKVRVENLGNEYKASVSERYEQVLRAAECASGRKLTKTRENGNALIRAIVAYRLAQEGYHYVEIGRTIGRDHSTVSHYIRKIENMMLVPNSYKLEISILNEFNRLVGE